MGQIDLTVERGKEVTVLHGFKFDFVIITGKEK